MKSPQSQLWGTVALARALGRISLEDYCLRDRSMNLRARAEITSHFGASAGRADARRRDEVDVGHRRGAATAPIRALRRRAPAGLQQNVKLFLREPLAAESGGEKIR